MWEPGVDEMVDRNRRWREEKWAREDERVAVEVSRECNVRPD
jgi:hypothetical protein